MNESDYTCFITKCLEFCKSETSFQKVEESLTLLLDTLTGKNIESIMSDILWFIDSMLFDSYNELVKDNFVIIVRLIEKNVALNSSFLKDRLSDNILESLNLINSKQQHCARYVKTKTRTFYKRNKFHLLHDANEGFSKLIVELIIFDDQTVLMAERIKSLIGYFDLDPTRVLDLILDVWELKLDRSTQFMELLSLLDSDKQIICDLIGHKLVDDTNDSIFDLIVTLVHHDVIDLLCIYEYLSPADDNITEHYDKDINLAKTKVFNNIFTTKLREVVSVENNEDIKIESGDYSDNQKIKLCFHFLKSGNWQTTKLLMNLLPPYFTLRSSSFRKMLCDVIHTMIEPIYNRCCSLSTMLKNRRQPKTISSASEFFEPINEYSDLNKLVFEMTNYLGPMLSTDMGLFSKLIRLTQSYFNDCKTNSLSTIDHTYQGFFNLVRNCLLPSLSMLNANVSLAEEIWDAIKYLPYDLRYSLYIYWKNHSNDDHPGLIAEKRAVEYQSKSILNRLNKDTAKQIGRQVGKLCHCNPGIVFNEILSSVAMFGNLSVLIVETIKYVGGLSLDVLMLSIIENLSDERMQIEGSQQSQWIQAISIFIGSLCKRYPFDLVGLFQFILNMIKNGRCSGFVIIIKEILHKMSGIEICDDITDEQMEAMSGGNLLRQEAGYMIPVRSTRKNCLRLKDIFTEHNLAIPLIIMLSQERNLVTHDDKTEHVKINGYLYDQYHDTLLQLITFFTLNGSGNETINNCPMLEELFRDYKLDPDTAFGLSRSHFNVKLQANFRLVSDVQLYAYDQLSNDDLELFSANYQKTLDEFVCAVVPYFPPKILDDFNSVFYTAFWLLQTNDLIVPEAAYRKQEIYLQAQIKLTELDKTLNAMKKQKEIERYNLVIEKLRDEEKRGIVHVKLIDFWLNSFKGQWFIKNKSGAAKALVMTRFIELCVFPRVCVSSNDAIFVGHLIYKLHRMKTPAFSTLICLDRVFNDITLMVSVCSENEAKRYGRFLDTILSIVMKWHSSEEIYKEECVAHPGFVTVFRKNTDGNNKADQLTYENYRHVLHKWHYRVTKSVVSCLESESYIQIRNALVVLEKVVNNYPKVQQFGQAIERRVELVKEKEKEKRPDLHALAHTYHVHLAAKKSAWLQDKDFHQKDETKKMVTKVTGTTSGDNRTEGTILKRASDVEDSDSSSVDLKRRRVDANMHDNAKVRVTKAAPSRKLF